MTVLTAVIIVAAFALYKEFKALIFDAGFLSTLGFSARKVDAMLMGLIVLTVMVGLQAVGVVLIAAMLITPAVAARFWSERLGHYGCCILLRLAGFRCRRHVCQLAGSTYSDGASDGARGDSILCCIGALCAAPGHAKGAGVAIDTMPNANDAITSYALLSSYQTRNLAIRCPLLCWP